MDVKETSPTSLRFTDEDREIMEKLQKLTGLDTLTAVIRLALREALAARERRSKR